MLEARVLVWCIPINLLGHFLQVRGFWMAPYLNEEAEDRKQDIKCRAMSSRWCHRAKITVRLLSRHPPISPIHQTYHQCILVGFCFPQINILKHQI